MTTHLIRFEAVDLHYAAVGFREDSLKSWLGARLRPAAQRPKVPTDIHALKQLTLEIRSGERVALLGHNGAGKSTLLKAVADLYPISAGRLTVRGEVRALFELGLGFEPDATGRENILYRGLLLGMTPAYMRRAEEEIVAFADLGEFIDYPLKTYSAGMKVRLAFAISTAVGGDILLLDEVLGAGDALFMVRARERIRRLIDESEILMLASHDLHTLAGACDRGLVLNHGTLAFDGPIAQAIAAYQRINGIAS